MYVLRTAAQVMARAHDAARVTQAQEPQRAERGQSLMKLFMMTLAAAACTTAPTTATHPTVIAASAAPLVEAWAAAAGGRDRLARIEAVHIAGTLDCGGLTGPFTTWETARGERHHEYTLGAAGTMIDVFDGTHAWQVDRNRKVRAVDSPELEDQVALGYLGANAALVLGRRPGQVTRDGDTLRIEPEGGRPLVVAFDPATHLPATISRRDAETVRVARLSDWRDVGGLRVPFTIREDDGEPRDAKTFHVDAVELDRAAPSALFARPADPPPDYAFASGGIATMPIDVSTLLVFVQTSVNGSPPMDFIVDTGAEVTVLNRSRLSRLGLEAVGELAIGGGGGNAAMSYVRGVSFALPGVQLRDQIVTAVPLDALEGPLGHRIDGILGYDFLSRFVVEIDYPKSKLTLYDRAAGHHPSGQPIPILLHGAIPSVRAMVDVGGRPVVAKLIVDTGCNCELQFSAPFTRLHRLIEASPKLLPQKFRGAGAETNQVVGRVAGLALGGLHLRSLIAAFSRDTAGVMADPDRAGLLGGDLLRRFVATFDYDRRTMWLAGGPGFDLPSKMISAGIQWTAGPDGLTVAQVIDGAPGAEAGLATGDVLVSIDATPAAQHTKTTLDRLFRQDGTPHAVIVRRGVTLHTMTVTPRSLL